MGNNNSMEDQEIKKKLQKRYIEQCCANLDNLSKFGKFECSRLGEILGDNLPKCPISYESKTTIHRKTNEKEKNLFKVNDKNIKTVVVHTGQYNKGIDNANVIRRVINSEDYKMRNVKRVVINTGQY